MSKRSAGQRSRRKKRLRDRKSAVSTDAAMESGLACPADVADVFDLRGEPTAHGERRGGATTLVSSRVHVGERWGEVHELFPGRQPLALRYRSDEAAARLGLAVWQLSQALRQGLIPEPDPDDRWPAELIDSMRDQGPALRDAIGALPPIGANRAAERMSVALDTTVSREDIEELVDLGMLTPAGEYKGWPTYAIADLDMLCAKHGEFICHMVFTRQTWLKESYTAYEARQMLGGWSPEEFEQVLLERGIECGRLGRFAHADIAELLLDEELLERVQSNRMLGPDQAAALLGIRRRDFDYCVAAGWISPTRWTQVSVTSRRVVDVPLYKAADLDDVLSIPGVDWDEVRAVAPGRPSPLREFAALPISRATAIREFAARIARRHGVPVATYHRWRTDSWHVRWTPDDDGNPQLGVVQEEMAADPELDDVRDCVTLETGPVARSPQQNSDSAVAGPSAAASKFVPQPVQAAPTWEQLRAKLAQRLAGSGAPGLSRLDAQTFAATLRSCGVVPDGRGDERHCTALTWLDDQQADDNAIIAALCGKLEDSVEHRFAVNLTRRDAQILMQYIDTAEK